MLQQTAPNYYIKPGTCCIDLAVLPSGVSLDDVAQKFPRGLAPTKDTAACTGYRPSDDEDAQLAQGTVSYETLLAAHRKRQSADAATARRAYEVSLAAMPTVDLCLAYGEAARGDAHADSRESLLKAIGSRKLSVLPSKVTTRRIGIGDSICHVLAALGLPQKMNRTVTSAGERVQHVYGGGYYVYTVNGRVTAWQD